MRDRYLYQFVVYSLSDKDFKSVIAFSYSRKQAVFDYLVWIYEVIVPNLNYSVHYDFDSLRRSPLFRLLDEVDVLSVYDGEVLIYKVSFRRLEK